MPNIRVIRVLVYEGPEDWVKESLARSWVQPGLPNILPNKAMVYERERTYSLVNSDPASQTNDPKIVLADTIFEAMKNA